MEFPRQEYCSGLPFRSAGDLLTQRSSSHLLRLTPALAGGFFTAEEVPKPYRTTEKQEISRAQMKLSFTEKVRFRLSLPRRLGFIRYEEKGSALTEKQR